LKLFKKILVANRGEIAVRIIRAAHQMGIKVVAVYSEPDKASLHVRLADESLAIGDEPLSDSYLNVRKIVQAAKKSRCQAIHPGYGFLAENPRFVEACEQAGITFIGPNSKVMALMGNKIQARNFIKSIGIPLVEGAVGSDPESIFREGQKMGFPLLLKAAAGGGGKGMRIVMNEEELKDGIEATSREAQSYFGDGTVYIEKYLEKPRHIEFQILGDHYGKVIHLYERECSIQRRYQKIIEESPSITLDPPTREKMSAAALKIGREIGYTNAGTIEFLVDRNLHFFFLEMNTRIQVEHPVTEWTSGIDLVQEQIKIAAGNPIEIEQKDIHQKGHAIEARIYAEDPANGFLPSPGYVRLYKEPQGVGIRVDSGTDGPVEIKSVFDPMISKLIVRAPNRSRAINILDRALSEYIVHGIKTNIPFLRSICQNAQYRDNEISTTFCDEKNIQLIEAIRTIKMGINLNPAAIACFLYAYKHQPGNILSPHHSDSFIWSKLGFWRHVMKMPFNVDGERNEVIMLENHDPDFIFQTQDGPEQVSLISLDESFLRISVGRKIYDVHISENGTSVMDISLCGWAWEMHRVDVLPELDTAADSGYEFSDNADSLAAPMPGKVIKIYVTEGEKINKGKELMVIEAMKMENKIVAGREATIKKIEVQLNQMVDGGKTLIIFE